MKQQRTGQEQFSRNITNGIIRFEKSGLPFVTGFLTPAQQNQALRLCTKVPHYLDGGRENALRARLIVGQVDPKDQMDQQTNSQFNEYDWDEYQDYSWSNTYLNLEQPRYTAILKSSYQHPNKVLSHSDVLGALMHAGLERDAIGDITADENTIYIVCLPSVEEFIATSVFKIGNVSVRFTSSDAKGMPALTFEQLKINTASMRADCIVSALAHCSRTMAKDMICQRFVKVNDEILETVKTLCNLSLIHI